MRPLFIAVISAKALNRVSAKKLLSVLIFKISTTKKSSEKATGIMNNHIQISGTWIEGKSNRTNGTIASRSLPTD